MRISDAVFAFAVAMAVSALLTPLAAWFARRIGAVARPTARGLATVETPLLGGLAILAGVLVAAEIWIPAHIPVPRIRGAAPGSGGIVDTMPILIGAIVIALVGAVDDQRDLPPGAKLLGQIGAATIAALGGVKVNSLLIPFTGHGLTFPNAGGVLTVIWLVGMMNVVNFSDGVDGLAAGVCTIDGVAFAIIAFDLNVPAAGVLAALTAGASLGFLFHNFHPASVFMGDSGSNLLGYLLGVAAVVGSIKTGAVVALAVPLVILAVPFLDTGFVVAKRLKYGRKPWSADANHFHHRMARIGFSQRRTVAYLYAWTILLAGLAVSLRLVPYHDHGPPHRYHLGWLLAVGGLALLALAASIYLVYVLEIFKFRGIRAREMREQDPDTSEFEIDARVKRDIETGEFEALQSRERE
jgi:UDP-GlcNAc:undecaprenyl-phosphate GlcNAc-1-phosphate transferase